ncbi:hypothetical protein D3C81_1740900 [compost metagenome]
MLAGRDGRGVNRRLEFDVQAEVAAARHWQDQVRDPSLHALGFQLGGDSLHPVPAVRDVVDQLVNFGVPKLDLFEQRGLLLPFPIDGLDA